MLISGVKNSARSVKKLSKIRCTSVAVQRNGFKAYLQIICKERSPSSSNHLKTKNKINQRSYIMAKIAIVIFADTTTIEALGKVSNAFMIASEAIENKDDLKIIFEGAGTKWIGELEKEDHKLHQLYLKIKPHITGVCSFCAQAFGVKDFVESSGLTLLSEYKSHPSLRNLVINNFQILTL